jgi:hypothetical protein
MPNGMRWVGLDVHAHATTLAAFDDVTGEVIPRRVVGRPMEVLGVLRELPRHCGRSIGGPDRRVAAGNGCRSPNAALSLKSNGPLPTRPAAAASRACERYWSSYRRAQTRWLK